MENKTPIFALIKGIEDDTIAREAIRITHELESTCIEDLAERSIDELVDKGASKLTISALQKELHTRNLSLRPAIRVPVTDLVSKLGDSQIEREVGLYTSYAKVTTVEDLARKTRDDLTNEGLSLASIELVERNLRETYNVELGNDCRESTFVQETIRGYDVLDEGRVVRVNTIPIRVSGRRNGLPKEKVLDIYRKHSEGKDPKDIAKEVSTSPLTVTIYLRRANVIPPANRYGSYSNTPASGAPPEGILQRYFLGNTQRLARHLGKKNNDTR